MAQSTTAIIILAVTIILFIIDKFPLALVSVASLLAMVLTGIMSFSDAFKGFSSSLVMLVIGMMIIGNALFENKVVTKIGNMLFGRFKGSEKVFLLFMMTMAAILSGFLHNIAVMAMMMPLVASFVVKSGDKFKLKNFFMALSHATIIGARFTLVGASPPMLAQNLLLTTEGVERGLGFFEMSAVAVPVFVIVLVCYYLFLYKTGDRLYDHSTTREYVSKDVIEKDVPLWKTWFTGIVMVALALGFVFIDGIDKGAMSLIAAVLLIATGCADGKTALKQVDWSTVIILGASTGIAACFKLTGLSDVIVAFLTEMGSEKLSPVFMVALFTVTSSLASNVLSNSTITIIFSTLAISVAQGLGISPIPLVVAVVFGGGCAFIFPTATSTLTMSNAAGYSFKDYSVIGSILSVICCISSIFFICLVYGLF